MIFIQWSSTPDKAIANVVAGQVNDCWRFVLVALVAFERDRG